MKLPGCTGIVTCHYKDPKNEPINQDFMECHVRGFERG